MPLPPIVSLYLNGNILKGNVPSFHKEDATSEAWAFNHCVRFVGQNIFTGDIVREHKEIVFVKPVDQTSISLYKILTRGEFLDKVTIDWYRYNEKTGKTVIYFQHTIQKAKISCIKFVMHHVKDPRFEQCGQLEEISIRYDRINWNSPAGNIMFTDRWVFSFLLPGMNESQQKEWEAMMEKPALTDELAEWCEQRNKATLKISNPRWEHTDAQLKKDSPKEASTGDVIKLFADIEGYEQDGKVTFEVYDVSKNTAKRIYTVSGKNAGGTACVEWTVKDPRKENETHELKLAFEASAKSKYSGRKGIPFKPLVMPEDRWIIFEEAVKTIEAVGQQQWWEPGPAKERWIYVFGATDGKTYADVWEVKTDKNGKFATFKLTKDNYANRPASESFEDVAFLPESDDSNKKYTFYAALSEIRFDKARIFDADTGIIADPKKRCLNIDDTNEVSRKVDDTGEEHIILLNYLRQADYLRSQFDTVFPDWEKIRLPSSAESDENRKKEKLIYEYGALILQILHAYPEYEKQFNPKEIESLKKKIQDMDSQKANLTGKLLGKVDTLCEWIKQDKFAETCRDYLALVCEGDTQPKAIYAFEERIAALFSEMTRFPSGLDTLHKLLPDVQRKDQQTWLQDLLLLKNDLWNTSGEHLYGEQKTGSDPVKTFKNARKISKRLIDLLKEAAKSGIGVYSPQNMGKIMQKVLSTCGTSVALELTAVSMKSSVAIRPFSQVMFSKSEVGDPGKVFKNFWDFKFPDDKPPKNLVERMLTSDVLDSTMNMLEGVSAAFAIWDVMNRDMDSAVNVAKNAKDLLSVAEFVWKVVMKKGKGPAYAVSVFTNAFDAFVAFQDADKASSNHDSDSMFWNYLAGGSFTVSAVAGAGALVATFYAGAASISLTGIGIAPGVLLFAVGTILAVTAKTAGDLTKNTAIENLFVISPWGDHPEFTIENCKSASIAKHFAKAVSVLNTFKVEIDIEYVTATLQLKQLEPETIITLQKVEFATSTTGNYQQKTVGTNIHITEENCIVNAMPTGGYSVSINLHKVCGTSNDIFWLANRPDFIKVQVIIDFKGDKTILLPDINKSVIAHRYKNTATTTSIE